jgi:hypothetical protein
MSTTINKGYATPTTGSEVGTWGTTLNDNVFAIIDRNLGGITTKNLSSSNVTLTAQESQSGILRLTGTLTANVQITTECIGFFLVENAASGAFAVTIKNNQVATAVTVAQGARTLVTSDATNGCRIGTKPFATGVKMAFYMAAAPVGWTKDTTAALSDAAIRIVTTTGGGTSGTTGFSTVFTSRSILEANLPAHTHGAGSLVTVSAGDHNHGGGMNQPYSQPPGTLPVGYINASGGDNSYTGSGWPSSVSHSNDGHSSSTTNTFDRAGPVYIPTGGAHTHALTGDTASVGSGTAMDFAVKYADFIICTAD